MPNREIVGHFSSRIEAELAGAMLHEHGVDAHVDADDAGGQHPELSMLTGGVRLLVPPDDLNLARDLLAAEAAWVDDEANAPGSADSADTARLSPRRRVAPIVVAIAVVVGLLVLADAVRQGGLLQLGS